MLPLSWSEVHFAQTWAFAVVALVVLAPAVSSLLRGWFDRRSEKDAEFVSPEMR